MRRILAKTLLYALILAPWAALPGAAGEPARGAAAAPDLEIPAGAPLVVRRSGSVTPGEYLRPPLGEGARGGVIVLEKLENVTLDLRGVVLRGAPPQTPRDKLAGWGIVVRDSSNVTILGGTITGYGGCIVAERTKNLVLDGVHFDHWYGMRLLSTVAAENEADWLWPHENDQGQWLARYGGAISFTDCGDAVIRNCRGRHGQNGILTLRCERLSIHDNDFSFLSGWGLAMYRTSHTVVSRNVFDYCVRGYSHGVYWRGQDSAAILMFERCSDNLIAYNSATHSGDGLFLFAGRDAVEGRAFERGEKDVGGSDRNLFYGNDFSYAVANGIEATFSADNRCVANRIRGCHQHGIWGGYSRRMVVYRNTIEETRGGAISIEHGQECLIAENALEGNEIGVELWWDEDPELVGGPFGKHFDTASRDALVLKNSFARNDQDLVVLRTQGLRLGENIYTRGARPLHLSSVRVLGAAAQDPAPAGTPADLEPLFTGIGGWKASGRIEDVDVAAFVLDPAAPPELLARELKAEPPRAPGEQRAFDPDRKPQAGREGLDTIVMGEWGPWDFRSGEPRPEQPKPGGLLAGVRWDAAWFSWENGPDPRGDAEAQRLWRGLAEKPLERATVETWYTPYAADPKIQERVGRQNFGLIATAEVRLSAGRYRLSVVSDDGVRVTVGGKTVLENWTWHGPTRDTVDLELSAGSHAFGLEYFQIDGASALSLDLQALP